MLGYFLDFDATVTASKADFSDAVFEVKARTASIDTREEQRNNHLKSADFFEVEKYPEMNYKSTAVKKTGKKKYKVYGNLTIRCITKKVEMDLVFNGIGDEPMMKVTKAGFKVTGMIKRSDFNLGPKFPLPFIGDEVNITANGEFIK